MTISSVSDLFSLFRQSITAPRLAARRVIDMPVPQAAVWQAFVLSVVLSVLQSEVFARLLPGAGGLLFQMPNSPLASVIVGVVSLFAMVLATYYVGRLFKGEGSFDGALRINIWLQLAVVALNLIQLVLFLLIPPMSLIIGVASIIVMMWMLTNFVAELHGFRALFPVFVMIILTGMALFFLLVLVLSVILPHGAFMPMEMS